MNPTHLRVIAGGEHYALPVPNVLEVSPLGEITPVPGAPPEVMGVRNLRGRVIPLVDLAAVLGLKAAEAPEWIVVSESEEHRCGLAVTATLDIAELGDLDDEADSIFLSGARLVDGAMVGVVDVTAILDALSPVPA